MTAKPRFDSDEQWKYRHHTYEEWEALKLCLQTKLKPFYPDKKAKATPPFAHPAVTWANYLLDEAESVLSMTMSLGLRLTNDELRAERSDVLTTLKKADWSLGHLSPDLDRMLGVDADVLGCGDMIRKLISRFEATGVVINQLPKARKRRDVQHAAAVEIAIRVLRILKGEGVSIAATTAAGQGRTSVAIQILKIIGDELRLPLSEVTWKDIIRKAKPSIPPRQ